MWVLSPDRQRVYSSEVESVLCMTSLCTLLCAEGDASYCDVGCCVAFLCMCAM